MNISSTQFNVLFEAYKEHCGNLAASSLGNLGKMAAIDYPSRIKSLYSTFGQQLIQWINKGQLSTIKTQLKNDPSSSSKLTALNNFITFIKGFENGLLRLSSTISDLSLAKLIASNVIFADKSVIEEIIKGEFGSRNNIGKGNPYASLDHCQKQRNAKLKGTVVPSPVDPSFGPVTYDDNTYANRLFKDAIRKGLSNIGIEIINNKSFKNFHVCHIWDEVATPSGKIKSVSDNRYFTSAANMVLCPSCIASITDHNDYVKSVLKYRVVELYGNLCQTGQLILPEPLSSIKKPKNYSKIIW